MPKGNHRDERTKEKIEKVLIKKKDFFFKAPLNRFRI